MVKSEKAFFEEWRKGLRRAVLGRMQGWVDEEYRRASEEEGERGVVDGDGGFGGGLERLGGMAVGIGNLPGVGSVVRNGALGLLRGAVAGSGGNAGGGWGADC